MPLESEVSEMWDFENERFDECSWSQHDKDVIELWDSESRKVDGHFEIPIPWKDRNEPLPNNFFVGRKTITVTCKDSSKERFNAEV